jgi:hypothetical protein
MIGFSFAEDFYPTTIGELNAQVRLYGTGNISNLKIGRNVTFETLTFQESEYQKIEIIKEVLHINGKDIYPEHIFDEFGNKYVKFTIEENGNFEYELIAKVNTTALLKKIDDYEINGYPDSVQSFTKKTTTVESNSNEILTVVSNKFNSKSFLTTLNETVFWVNDYVEYATGTDFQKYYLLQKSAIDTLISKKGVCDEFANLAAAILRAKEIPTRLAIGVTFDGREWGNHAWLEVYHNQSGWIPSDPTFREPGFVDATHIKLGSFSDVTLSLAKAVYPEGTDVTFQTQTLPEITIIDKKYFSHVTLTWQKTQLKTNQWNDVNVEVKNNTNGVLTIPLKVKENYSELIFDNKTQSVSLEGGKTEVVTFKIYPNISLKTNEVAKGNLTFNSLAQPYQIEFEIISGQEQNNGLITVTDVTPIAMDKTLRFFIEVKNNNKTDQQVTINIDSNKWQWVETINAFETKQFLKDIPLEEREYNLKINTLNEKYSKIIIPAIQEIVATQKETIETIIVQEIKTGNDIKLDDNIFSNPLMWVFAILPILAIGILIIIATRRKYM